MNSALRDNDWTVGANDDAAWERKFLLLPRVALKIGRHGIRRRLLWPGTYETRVSRSVGKRVFRDLLE